MPAHKVSIALEENFLGDRVLISAGGRALADLEGLSTRVQIGLARTLEVELNAGETLTVELPEKGLKTEIPLGAQPPPYVGVSVAGDGASLAVRTGAAAPGYV